MLVPYFLTMRVFDDCPEYSADLAKEEVQRVARNSRAVESSGGQPSDKLKAFTSSMMGAIAAGEFKHKTGEKRKDADDSEQNITLGLHVWYLREFDPEISFLAWGAEIDVSPAYQAIKDRIRAEYSGLNDREFTSYFGNHPKSLQRRIKTALEKGFHAVGGYDGDAVNLITADYLCSRLGIAEADRKEVACKILARWKYQRGLISADDVALLDQGAVNSHWPIRDDKWWLADPDS